jgi:hypothetical protein
MLSRLLFVFFLVALSGCSTYIKIPSSESLKRSDIKLQNNQEKFFSGLFLTDDSQGNRLRYAIQFVDPQKLRVELYPTTSFYQLGLLIVDNQRYKFVNSSENQLEVGEFSPLVLQDKIGLELSVPQLISAVVQKIPSDISSYVSYTDNSNNLYVFSDDKSFIGVFDQITLTPKEFFYFNNDDLLAKIIISKTIPDCKMQVMVPKYDFKVEVECLMFKNDKRPQDSRFELD